MARAANLQTVGMNETGVFIATIFGTVLPRAATENRVDAIFDGEGKDIRTVRPVDKIANFKSGAEFFLKIDRKIQNLLMWNVFKRFAGSEETDSKTGFEKIIDGVKNGDRIFTG